MGGRKNISPAVQFGCCVSIGGAGIGVIPKGSAFIEGNVLYIAFLSDAHYSIETEKGLVQFSVSGGYPDNDKIRISFAKLPKNGLYLKIRKPEWCKKHAVSGMNYTLDCGYFASTEKISEKCRIEIKLDMPLEFTLSESVNKAIDYRIALTKGPIVLAKDSFKGDDVYEFDTEQPECNKIVDEFDRIAYEVKMKNGEFVTLNKYSDCAKQEIDVQALNVWFKRK